MTGAGRPHIGCVSTSRGAFLFSPKITWYLSRLPVCPLSTRRLGWVSSPTPWIVSTCPRGPRTPARPWKEEVPAQPGPAPPPAGFLWFECKEVWIEGLRSYLLDWWNFLDMVILSLYLAAFALRLLLAGLAHVHCKDAPDGAACRYFTTAGECPGLGPEPGPPPRSSCSRPQPPRPVPPAQSGASGARRTPSSWPRCSSPSPACSASPAWPTSCQPTSRWAPCRFPSAG